MTKPAIRFYYARTFREVRAPSGGRAHRPRMPDISASVRTTPWIPVLIDGRPQVVDLETTLTRAHEIEDLDVRDDLERSAILRFLVGWTTLVVRQQKLNKRSATAAALGGFDPAAVRAVLDRFDDRLDLLDADRPFMQDRQAEVATLKPMSTLHPSAASWTAQEWFVMRDAVRTTLSVSDTIRSLITYYFHTPRTAAGGPKIELAHDATFTFALKTAGAANHALTGRSDMQMWWHGTNLASTLLLNIPARWVNGDTSVPAWLDAPRLDRESGSLSEWTHSGTAALLVPELDDAGAVVFSQVHTCGIIMQEDAEDDAAFKLALDAQMRRTYEADPRRVFVDRGKPGKPWLWQVSGIEPANTTVQNLAAWWDNVGHPTLARGFLPLSPEITADIDVLAVTLGSSMGTDSIKAAAWTTIDRGVIGDDMDDTSVLRTLAQAASIDVERALQTAARSVFPRGSSKSAGSAEAALAHATINQFYVTARTLLDTAVEAAFRGDAVPDDLPTRWWAAAIDAFDDAAAPFASLGTMPRIAIARAELLRVQRAATAPIEEEDI